MPRVAGIDIPKDKQVFISLTYIFGVGESLAKEVLKEAKVDFQKKTKDLTDEELKNIRDVIEKKYKVEGDLRRDIMMNIKRLKNINSLRGERHEKGLPGRGQRTQCNSRTVRGNVKRTMGSGRTKPPQPK